MTMITPSYLGETIEYSSLHACRSTLEDPTKIRGYRIEPGEIVASIDRHPGIEASAVVAHDTSGGPVLLAYVVPAHDARPTTEELCEFLAARLPDYMVPNRYVKIAELPTTANGKLDKSALPAPCAANLLPNRAPRVATSSAGVGVQPRIAALVASLLGQAAVATDDNFFMIGGHSMLGVQLVARIRDMFGVKLNLRQLFSAPTVAALSAEVERLAGTNHV